MHRQGLKQSFRRPGLGLASPEKRCGKTTCLRLVGAVAARPLTASNVTAAVVFRTVEMVRPTLLIDEADSFIRGNDELRGIVNSGHARDGAVIRHVAHDPQPSPFSPRPPIALPSI